VALRARRFFIKLTVDVAVFAINFLVFFVQSYSGNDMIEVFGIPSAVTSIASCFKIAEFAFRYMASTTI